MKPVYTQHGKKNNTKTPRNIKNNSCSSSQIKIYVWDNTHILQVTAVSSNNCSNWMARVACNVDQWEQWVAATAKTRRQTVKWPLRYSNVYVCGCVTEISLWLIDLCGGNDIMFLFNLHHRLRFSCVSKCTSFRSLCLEVCCYVLLLRSSIGLCYLYSFFIICTDDWAL